MADEKDMLCPLSINNNSNNLPKDQWKRPSDIMKKIRVRKKKVAPARTVSLSQPAISTNCKNNQPMQKIRSNPFAKKRSSSENQPSCKRRFLSIGQSTNVDEEEVFASSISNIYHESESNISCNTDAFQPPKEEKELSNDDLAFVYLNEDSIQGIFNENLSKPEVKEEPGKDYFPVDWSIKTKARFLSASSFAWCARLKGAEEANAIDRATYQHLTKVDSSSQADLRVELVKSLVYWQHPSLPWFSLFPRFGADCKVVPHGAGEAVTDENIKSSLYDSWAAAFRSAYQMLRQGHCSFFYVCSQMYTALFRGTLGAKEEVNCILTPTSLGFRNSLKSEGIEFTMPLKKEELVLPSDLQKHEAAINPSAAVEKESRSESKSVETGDDDKENVEDEIDAAKRRNAESRQNEIDEEEEEQSWKSISDGLNLRHGREISSATQSDGLPRTAVLVCGSNNTQLLFNYLLNCRSSIANSGPQAGLPPTLLAPTAFMGASMKKLEHKAGIARTTASDVARHVTPTALQHNFSLDVSGPLLPNHVRAIVTLLGLSQSDADFSAALSTRPYTIPFNANPPATPTRPADDVSGKNDYVTMRQLTSIKGGTFKWSS